MRMMVRGIKVGVVSDFDRQLHHNIRLAMENALAQFLVIAQRRRFGREQFLQDFAGLSPRRSTEREEFIQGIAR